MLNITDRSLAAVKWSYLGVVARIVTQLVVQIALARLLGPEVFGLFAAALLVLGIGGIVVEMGLGSALIQKRDLTESDVRFAFTWVLLASFAMAVAVFLLSGYFADFFDDSRIADVLRGLTPAFIIQALGIVPVSLLKRELAFKAVQGVLITSYLGGYLIIGVGAALLGAGVWSLVAAWIAQNTLATISLLAIRRHSAKPLFRDRSSLFKGFGSRVLLTNLLNWIIENVDNLLVGRFFGPTALGLYSVSYNLVRNPANHLVVTLQTVLFPVSARAQDNLDGLRRAYLTVLAGVALIAFPLFTGVAAVAGTVVEALFGSQWIESVPILMPLSIAMIVHAAMAISGPILWGMGAAGTELKVQAVIGVIFVATLFMASRISLQMMAWAVCFVYCLRWVGMTATLLRKLHIPVRAGLSSLRGAILASLITTSLLLISDHIFSELAPFTRLAIDIVLSGIVLLMFVYKMPNFALSVELAQILHGIIAPVPILSKWSRRLQTTHQFKCTHGAS